MMDCNGGTAIAAKVHPGLLEQLDRAGAEPVQAIFQLRTSDDADAKLAPDAAANLADQLLARVAAKVGHPARRANVLRNLATMIVEADPEFLRSLIGQPEIASASANKTAESPFMPPKGKPPV
jgi:hypothetical protein